MPQKMSGKYGPPLHPRFRPVSYTHLDVYKRQQEYGVATQKDSALSQPVAEAIQGMLDDGTIAELTDKWD